MSVFSLRSGRDNGRRCVLQVERLETRELPSGVPFGLPSIGVNLSIQDTQVTMSPLGLPAAMAGNIYSGNQTTGQVVGSYREALTPIFANGQFVGTTGIATFTFFVPTMPNFVYETITTADTSYITGVDPTNGGLLVTSTGTITDSKGIFGDLQGSFTSTSDVVLGPQFDGTTHVHFTIGIA